MVWGRADSHTILVYMGSGTAEMLLARAGEFAQEEALECVSIPHRRGPVPVAISYIRVANSGDGTVRQLREY
jgi:hypothetical protein